MDFSTAVFPGGAAERQQRIRLLCALLASLGLHGGSMALLPLPPATAAGLGWPAPAGSAASAVQATLRGGVPQPAPADGPVAVLAPALPVVDLQPAADRQSAPPASSGASESPQSVPVLVTLGQRRLAEYLPPYLANPVPLTLPTGPWYFPRAELSLPPVLLDQPLIQPPETAGSAGLLVGKVVVRVFVGVSGAVERVEVASSNLPPAFEEAAVAAFSRLRFRPGEIAGVAVSSETRFEVVFDGGEGRSSHATDGRGLRQAPGRAGVAKGLSGGG